MEKFSPKVDAYIAKSATFAQPVMEYLRQIVHDASPLLTETIKWGFPFFDYKGPVCQMAAFKQHCAFGFWKAAFLNDPYHVIRIGESSAGSFGKITHINDLPSNKILTDLILQAIGINELEKKPETKMPPVVKPPVETPDYFIDFLGQDIKAVEVFNNFTASQKKEYAVWILDAKSEATRQSRMETALEWILEGKTRNWKYK